MSASSNDQIFTICSEMSPKTHRFNYQLSIDKFRSMRMMDGFRSDLFAPPGLNEPKFYIECSKSLTTQHSKLLSLFVCQNVSNVYVKFDIKGLDENGRKQFSKTSEKFSQLSKSILLCEFSNHSDYSGDKLQILCEFTFKIDSITTTQTVLPSAGSLISAKVDKFQGYHQGLNPDQKTALVAIDMMQNGNFSDVEIVVGRRSFRAHKFMLATRSPVFAAMFEHDLVESRSNKVEIVDVDEETFEHLLRYIYANIVPPNESNADELLAAADKYQLNELKNICESRLISKLNEESMYDLLLIADTYNAAKLKDAAIKYISSRFNGPGSFGYNNNSNSAITKLFQNHLTGGLIEAMRKFDQDAKSKGLLDSPVKSQSPFGF